VAEETVFFLLCTYLTCLYIRLAYTVFVWVRIQIFLHRQKGKNQYVLTL